MDLDSQGVPSPPHGRRRSNSRSSSPSSAASQDDEAADLLRAKLASHFGEMLPLPNPPAESATNPQKSAKTDDLDELPARENEAEVVEFRLFASAAPSKLVIKNDDDPELAEGRFLEARPRNWYRWQGATAEMVAEQARLIAVSGETVRLWEQEKGKCKGLELPWREIAVSLLNPATVTKRRVKAILNGTSETRKRKRPGKKSRIAMRKATVKTRYKQTMDREKKTRLNHEKKIKKRAREKAKKAASAKT